MKRFEIFLMERDVETVVAVLHDAMIVEISDIEGRKVNNPMDADLRARIDRMIDFLDDHRSRPKGLIRSMLPEEWPHLEVPSSEPTSFVRTSIERLESAISPFRNGLAILEEEGSFLRESRTRLSQISGLDVDLASFGAARMYKVRIGFTRRLSELRTVVEASGGDVLSSLLDRREGLHAVHIVHLARSSGKIDDTLRGKLFTEMSLDRDRMVSLLSKYSNVRDLAHLPISEVLPIIDSTLETISSRSEALAEKARVVCDRNMGEAMGLKEVLDIEADKGRASDRFLRNRYTAMVSGWVASDRTGEIDRLLSGSLGKRYQVDLRDPTEEEIGSGIVPTQLRNGPFTRLFESLTTTFATPRYDEIDPTPFISIPFILFFGMMMGDAGYGLLILIPSLYLMRVGKKSHFLRNVSLLGVLMGASSILAGLWMGAFFGDLVPRLIYGDPRRPLYSLSLLGYDLPYDSLRDPMQLFAISMLLGVLQINIGFLLVGYDRLRKRDIWGIAKGTLSWLLIQAGAGILLGGFLLGIFDLGGPLLWIGAALFFSGTFLLVFETKVMTFFSMEGLIGDIVSYTRILALGLSTFGLAMAFNIIGEMINGITPWLIPVSALFLAALHVVNLPIQMLGGFVHSLRLQYVEFFGKFYEGGGRPFEHFGRERVHSRLVSGKGDARR